VSDNQCDALVFFGATGDLAYKKIFPSLQAMIKRGTLNIPIVGVAKSGWSLERLRERARQPGASRWYRYGGIRQAHGATALHRRRL
jgi:glucose-6-phosphate 1-dehydrogenase